MAKVEDKDDQTDKPTAYIADLADFQPDPDNLNLHTQRGQALVTQSQQKRGYGRPAFAANDGTVLGGNLSTMEVASDIGLGNGKVLVVETTGDIPIIHKRLDVEPGSVEAKLLAAEDNRSAEVSIAWDPTQLLLDKEAGIDFGGLFYDNELDEITAEVKKEPSEDVGPQIDRADELRKVWGTRLGQIWQLGRHKIACVDSTDEETVRGLLGYGEVGMVWADPPYGINEETNRNEKGRGKLTQSVNWSPVLGDDKSFDPSFLLKYPKKILWGANYYANKLPESSSWVIWDKRDGVTSDDNADCEMAWTDFGGPARIFRHLWKGMIKASEHGQRRVHPTQKPVALFEWVANKYFKDGGIVFDPFLGSGISVIGAENMGNKIFVIGCELSPGYIAVIIQRWVDLTGREPELANG